MKCKKCKYWDYHEDEDIDEEDNKCPCEHPNLNIIRKKNKGTPMEYDYRFNKYIEQSDGVGQIFTAPDFGCIFYIKK